jgi:hypothetical protein
VSSSRALLRLKPTVKTKSRATRLTAPGAPCCLTIRASFSPRDGLGRTRPAQVARRRQVLREGRRRICSLPLAAHPRLLSIRRLGVNWFDAPFCGALTSHGRNSHEPAMSGATWLFTAQEMPKRQDCRPCQNTAILRGNPGGHRKRGTIRMLFTCKSSNARRPSWTMMR